MLGLRLIYFYPWKDYENEFRRKSPAQLQDYVRRRLETITKRERIWIVIIAGVGFFADAYAIFAINLVIPMLEIVYWQGNMPQRIQIGITIATLGGSMLGQLLFGIAADRLGRRRMYGWELIVTIVATIGIASASSGVSGIVPSAGTYQVNGTYPSDGTYNADGIDSWNGSLSIIGGLVAWRFVLGLAIGSGYPLSAVICSEFAPKKNRARMLSAVFFFQPLGQLAATLISLIVTAGYETTLSKYNLSQCTQHPDCLRTVDIMWRIIIGLGALLPAVALGFRFAILESPRYTVDVLKKGVKAAAQLNAMGEEPSVQSPPGSVTNPPARDIPLDGGGAERAPVDMRGKEDDQIRQAPPDEYHVTYLSDGDVTKRVPDSGDNRGAKSSSFLLEQKENQQEVTSGSPNGLRADVKRYFGVQGHKWTLIGTSLCWFCVDLPFYGLGMNSTSIISQIWTDEDSKDAGLYSVLISNSWESLIFVSIGAITGGLITFFSINRLGEQKIQIIGFSVLFFLFILTGGLLRFLMNARQDKSIIFLYVMCQTFFNFGPNTTTYIIPSEFFPTRYRASCHGISAASGKLGSVIAQAIIYGVYVRKPPNDIQDWLGWMLLGFSPLMLVGLLATIFLIPPIRGQDGQPLSLEQLAAEHERPQNRLYQLWKRKPKVVHLSNGQQDEEIRGQVDKSTVIVQDGLLSGELGQNLRHEIRHHPRQDNGQEVVHGTT